MLTLLPPHDTKPLEMTAKVRTANMLYCRRAKRGVRQNMNNGNNY